MPVRARTSRIALAFAWASERLDSARMIWLLSSDSSCVPSVAEVPLSSPALARNSSAAVSEATTLPRNSSIWPASQSRARPVGSLCAWRVSTT